jgi:hypothetical protein
LREKMPELGLRYLTGIQQRQQFIGNRRTVIAAFSALIGDFASTDVSLVCLVLQAGVYRH